MDLLTRLKKYTDFSNGISQDVCKLRYEDTTFENINFTGYDLNNSSFLEVIFNDCNFSTVYLSGASLCGSLFNKCIFNNNIFRKGRADYANFIKSDFQCIDTFRTSFYEANLENLNVIESEMKNCNFVRAKFTEIKFIKTDFTKTNFNNSEFKNVVFENCYFNETKFKDIKGIDEIEFKNVSVFINGEIKSNVGNELKRIL